MSKGSRPSPLVPAGHGSFAFLPPRYQRESGLLAATRLDGSELRLHRTEGGRWEAIEWREATGADGRRQWIGPTAGPLEAADWIAAVLALGRAEAPAPQDDLRMTPP